MIGQRLLKKVNEDPEQSVWSLQSKYIFDIVVTDPEIKFPLKNSSYYTKKSVKQTISVCEMCCLSLNAKLCRFSDNLFQNQ